MIDPIFPTPPAHESTRTAAVSIGNVWFDRGIYCKKCNHLGRFFAEDLSIYPDGGHFITQACDCAANDLGPRSLMSMAGIPATYQLSTFDNWNNTGRVPPEVAANEETRRVIMNVAGKIEQARKEGLNVWIYGGGGTGKTWLAVALIRAAMNRGLSGAYVDAASLMRLSIDERAEMGTLTNAGVLIIDGVERLSKSRTDYAEGVLLDLITYRVANRHMTIFTSVERESELKPLNNLLDDITARFALIGEPFKSGVADKWQTP